MVEDTDVTPTLQETDQADRKGKESPPFTFKAEDVYEPAQAGRVGVRYTREEFRDVWPPAAQGGGDGGGTATDTAVIPTPTGEPTTTAPEAPPADTAPATSGTPTPPEPATPAEQLPAALPDDSGDDLDDEDLDDEDNPPGV